MHVNHKHGKIFEIKIIYLSANLRYSYFHVHNCKEVKTLTLYPVTLTIGN